MKIRRYGWKEILAIILAGLWFLDFGWHFAILEAEMFYHGSGFITSPAFLPALLRVAPISWLFLVIAIILAILS